MGCDGNWLEGWGLEGLDYFYLVVNLHFDLDIIEDENWHVGRFILIYFKGTFLDWQALSSNQ